MRDIRGTGRNTNLVVDDTQRPAAFVFFAAILLGPSTSRSYLEPYFWLLIVFAMQPKHEAGRRGRWLEWPIAAQALVTIALFWYGAATLLPGALAPRWRAAMMERSADGYSVMQWADSVLPANAVLLNGHRSMALAPRDAVTLSWATWAKIGSPAAQPYLARLKDRGVTHLLTFGDPPDLGRLAGCVGKRLAGPGYGRLATRNPFNVGQQYKAWIFSFDAKLLPGCATATRQKPHG